MYWIENLVVYIPYQLTVELSLLPWDYFRTMYYIILNADAG